MTLAEDAQRLQLIDGGIGSALALEAQRYLDAVEFFRSQGCQPHWAPEPSPYPPNSCHLRPASRPVADLPRRMSC